LQDLALDGSAVADAVDVELLPEAAGDAGDEIRHLRARHAPLLAGAFRKTARPHVDGTILDRDRHVVGRGERARALRPLDGDRLTRIRGLDPLRERHRSLSDTRHGAPPQNTVQSTSPPT